MKPLFFPLLVLITLAGCGKNSGDPATPASEQVSLTEARRGFTTKLIRQESEKEAVAEPSPGMFRTVRYESPSGKLAAYMSVAPKDGKKHPARVHHDQAG